MAKNEKELAVQFNEVVNTVTSILQLQEYAQGQLVELPPFGEDQPFFARLKRPSLISLAKAGKIPNELLNAAGELFSSSSKTKNTKDSNSFSKLWDMMEAVCEASFVSPTYKEIREAGIELTDEQKNFVFQYSQEGAKALKGFRTK